VIVLWGLAIWCMGKSTFVSYERLQWGFWFEEVDETKCERDMIS
jgi:hypothetical protein